MIRGLGALVLLVLGLCLLSCSSGDDLVASATRGIEVGTSRANVIRLLSSRKISFETRAPVKNAPDYQKQLFEMEALESPIIYFFVSEPYGEAHTKTTRVIVVFDDQDLVARVLINETFL